MKNKIKLNIYENGKKYVYYTSKITWEFHKINNIIFEIDIYKYRNNNRNRYIKDIVIIKSKKYIRISDNLTIYKNDKSFTYTYLKKNDKSFIDIIKMSIRLSYKSLPSFLYPVLLFSSFKSYKEYKDMILNFKNYLIEFHEKMVNNDLTCNYISKMKNCEIYKDAKMINKCEI